MPVGFDLVMLELEEMDTGVLKSGCWKEILELEKVDVGGNRY